ncbi:hypothetical protein [Enterococcus sp. LJL90]
MLEIHYIVAGNEQVKTYKNPTEFVARQQLEVPDIEDYYTISKVTLDGQEVALPEKTIGGLFNFYNK